MAAYACSTRHIGSGASPSKDALQERRGGGVWNLNICVPKMAGSFGKFHFFQLQNLGLGGRGTGTRVFW